MRNYLINRWRRYQARRHGYDTYIGTDNRIRAARDVAAGGTFTMPLDQYEKAWRDREIDDEI